MTGVVGSDLNFFKYGLLFFSTTANFGINNVLGGSIIVGCSVCGGEDGDVSLDAGTTVNPLQAGATTPIPGALPLFAWALGALGLLGWRKSRKAHAPN